jgi:hypothetical protein
MFVQTNTGIGNYHGVTFEVERRFSGRISFHGGYTLSQAKTNVDSLANLADIPEGKDIDGEMARSRQDVRHRFTLSAIGQAAAGIRVSGLVSLESGRPFNVFVGRDANGDGNPNSDRPGLIGRNAYEGRAIQPSTCGSVVNSRSAVARASSFCWTCSTCSTVTT